MRRLIEAVRFSFVSLKELFFPRRCIVCSRPLPPERRNLCRECRDDLPLTYFWDWVQNPAFERIVGRIPAEAAASLFFFRHEAGYNRILHSIKYNGNRELGLELGRVLGDYLAGSPFFKDIDAVVPVPLHAIRKWRRGYNQAEVIARGISSSLGKPLAGSLVKRVKSTRTQTRLHGKEKSRNVAGAFAADRAVAEKMAGAGVGHILLVDDVMTSGATLSECAKPLLELFKISVASLSFVE